MNRQPCHALPPQEDSAEDASAAEGGLRLELRDLETLRLLPLQRGAPPGLESAGCGCGAIEEGLPLGPGSWDVGVASPQKSQRD